MMMTIKSRADKEGASSSSPSSSSYESSSLSKSKLETLHDDDNKKGRKKLHTKRKPFACGGRVLFGLLILVWFGLQPLRWHGLLPRKDDDMYDHIFALASTFTTDKSSSSTAKSLMGLSPTQLATHCGTDWTVFRDTALPTLFSTENEDGSAATTTTTKPLLWTVSGGESYRHHMTTLLYKWKSLGMYPVWIIALDRETTDLACSLGYPSFLWDEPQQTYARVADSKFGVAATLAENGIYGLFLELDVFCNVNPLPLLQSYLNEPKLILPEMDKKKKRRRHQGTDSKEEQKEEEEENKKNKPVPKRAQYDMVVMGHGDIGFNPNIGMYFVRPTPAMVSHFRSVLRVLRYSKESREFINQNGKTKMFFDQTVFYHCLPNTNEEDSHVRLERQIFRLDDNGGANNNSTRHDFMLECKNKTSPQFHYKIVPHVYMSSHNPPMPHDSAYCVHPLANAAFSSFEHKLATAKYLGYDPQTPIPPTERILKTVTGELLYNECWNTVYLGTELAKNKGKHAEIVRNVATLVWLARRTNRTLAVPRQIRDKNAWPALLMSLIDVTSIAQTTDDAYRYLSPQDKVQLGGGQTVVQAAPYNTKDAYYQLLERIEQLPDERVVAVDALCRTLGNVPDVPDEVQVIASQLSHCMNEYSSIVNQLHSRAIVSWGKLCGSQSPLQIKPV